MERSIENYYLLFRYGIDTDCHEKIAAPYSEPNYNYFLSHLDNVQCCNNKISYSKDNSVSAIANQLEENLKINISTLNVTLLGSSGLDSAIIAAALKNTKKDVNVLTISFYDEWNHFDESFLANKLYDELGLRHQVIKMSADNFFEGQEISHPIRRFFTPHLFSSRQCSDESTIVTGYGSHCLFNHSPISKLDHIKGGIERLLDNRQLFDNKEILSLLNSNVNSTKIESNYKFRIESFLKEHLYCSNNIVPNKVLDSVLYGWQDFYSNILQVSQHDKKSIYLPFLDKNLMMICSDHLLRHSKNGRNLREALAQFYKIPLAFITKEKRGFIPPVEMWMKNDLKCTINEQFNSLSERHNIINFNGYKKVWKDFIINESYSMNWLTYCKIWILLQTMNEFK